MLTRRKISRRRDFGHGLEKQRHESNRQRHRILFGQTGKAVQGHEQ